jgi:hypothetical protein
MILRTSTGSIVRTTTMLLSVQPVDWATRIIFMFDCVRACSQQYPAWHTPPDFPCRNTTNQPMGDNCSERCLYNLRADVEERHNLIRSTAPADIAALHRLSAYYESLGDGCGAQTIAGATACQAAGCGWDKLNRVCRVYHLPDALADDPKACVAINNRGGYWGPWSD